jgi:spore coat polysaccharide biosynthesis protein SpsF (cytidylyltransferase family)
MKQYKYALEPYLGDLDNVAKRLYEAGKEYEYIIRVTGDDIFVDTTVLNEAAHVAMSGEYDYSYTAGLIRGCDCDVMKVSALAKIQEIYNTSNIESIEFLFMNENFKVNPYVYNDTYCRSDISLTLDTPEDWEIVKLVWERLSSMNYHFSTWDVVEFFSRNKYLMSLNKKPLVTVYMVYKSYPIKWLQEALASLQAQTFQDFEFILIDYGSEMIHSKFKELSNNELFRTFMIEGMSFIDAIKYAISKAQGKYIIRLDVDDTLYPTALEEMVAYITENPVYSAVIANHDRCDEDMNILLENVEGNIDNVMSCAMIVAKKYKYVDFLTEQYFRDGTTLLEVFKKYDLKIGYYKRPLFKYRLHDTSLTHGTGKEELIREEDIKIKERLA